MNPNEAKVFTNDTAASGRSQKKWLLWTLGGLITTLVIFIAILWVGIYKIGWQSGPFVAVGRQLNLPAAKVGGQTIGLNAFLTRRSTLAALQQPVKNALPELIDQTYIQQYASQHNLVVSQKEIDTAITDFSRMNKLPTANTADYRQYVATQLLTTKIQAALQKDKQQQQIAKQHAEEILKALKAGQDFSSAIREASNGAIFNNAAIPPVPLNNTLPPVIALTVNKLKIGEFASNPVASGNGYLIIQRVKATDGGIPQANLLFVGASYPLWLKNQHETVPAKVYLPHVSANEVVEPKK